MKTVLKGDQVLTLDESGFYVSEDGTTKIEESEVVGMIDDGMAQIVGEGDVSEPSKADPLEKMMEGMDSELAGRMKTVFTAQVKMAVDEQVEAYQGTVKDLIEQTVTARFDALADDLAAKTETFAESWIDANEVALVSGTRLELAESFVAGMMDVMKEHNVTIPEEQIDPLAEAEQLNADIESKLTDALDQTAESKKEIKTLKRTLAMRDVSEGLSEVQKGKLNKLAESVSFDSVEQFTKEVTTLRDEFIGESKTEETGDFKPETPEETVTESKDDDGDKETVSESKGSATTYEQMFI